MPSNCTMNDLGFPRILIESQLNLESVIVQHINHNITTVEYVVVIIDVLCTSWVILNYRDAELNFLNISIKV